MKFSDCPEGSKICERKEKKNDGEEHFQEHRGGFGMIFALACLMWRRKLCAVIFEEIAQFLPSLIRKFG